MSTCTYNLDFSAYNFKRGYCASAGASNTDWTDIVLTCDQVYCPRLDKMIRRECCECMRKKGEC